MQKVKCLQGWQLAEILDNDPKWAENLNPDEKIEVISFVTISNPKVQGLNKNLTFKGINNADGKCVAFENCVKLKSAEASYYGPVSFRNCGLQTTHGILLDPESCSNFAKVADFTGCKHLTLATGKWPGLVDYSQCGIAEVKDLIILAPNVAGEAVFFNQCNKLTEISGTFPGLVSLKDCENLRSTKGLTISSPNKQGYAALLRNCTKLELAQGDFNGSVDWKGAGIKEIDTNNLKIKAPNLDGWAACFWGCENLLVAKGEFIGAVDFSHSNIQECKNLKVLHPNKSSIAALFCSCQKLKKAEGDYQGSVDFSGSSIGSVGDLKINSKNCKIIANFHNCHNLKSLPTWMPASSIHAPKEIISKLERARKISLELMRKNDSLSNLEI